MMGTSSPDNHESRTSSDPVISPSSPLELNCSAIVDAALHSALVQFFKTALR